MLDHKGFDQWAGEYDAHIAKNSKGYPFEGYYDVLAFVNQLVIGNEEIKVLDLGVGTGLLTQEMYKRGSVIHGVDISKDMIAIAKEKMPNASFYQHDLTLGLPNELEGKKFDYIVSSYAIHHLLDKQKVDLIEQLKKALITDGKIIIADVAFQTRADLDACKNASGRSWDDDEEYIVANEMLEKLRSIGCVGKYTQISFCAGVLEIQQKNKLKLL